MKLGFIGLGIMGTPMAGHLLSAGHSLFVYARTTRPDVLSAGPVLSVLSRGCAEGRHHHRHGARYAPMLLRFCSLPIGLAAGLSAGKTVVDMSSISPIATKDFARRIGELGCDYLDAPVSGGEVGAKQASLSIMVGGSAEAFARVKPIFELLGRNITHVGGPGDGQTAKVANQIVVGLTIGAVAEALVFASKAGADPSRVRQALMGGFASSRILEVHGERMVNRTFDPGFRVELHQKDLNNALDQPGR